MKPPRYVVAWRTKNDPNTHAQLHTAKPTARGHVRGLRRNPSVVNVVMRELPKHEEA